MLVVGAVADPHRAGVVVAGQVRQLLLDQSPLPADAVHHLELAFTVVGAADVVDEREEVVRLAVQPQRVQAPQREGRIAHPGVAVVPIAFALRGFRQRRGAARPAARRWRVGQPLQRQRAALQVRPPRVIREVADVDPLPPALAGPPHPVGGLVVGLRRRVLGPGQRDEHVVALLHPGAARASRPSSPMRRLVVSRRVGMRSGLRVGPRDRLAVGAAPSTPSRR